MRNGDEGGVEGGREVWRGGGGVSVSSAQNVEGGPALWLPGPPHRTGVLGCRCASKQPGGGGQRTGAM